MQGAAGVVGRQGTGEEREENMARRPSVVQRLNPRWRGGTGATPVVAGRTGSAVVGDRALAERTAVGEVATILEAVRAVADLGGDAVVVGEQADLDVGVGDHAELAGLDEAAHCGDLLKGCLLVRLAVWMDQVRPHGSTKSTLQNSHRLCK